MGCLRLALALAVLFSHLPDSGVRIMSGALAVQAFFIISGFYMALVLNGKYNSAGLFYSNRLLRLLPCYFALLVASAVLLFAFQISATAPPQIFALLPARPLHLAAMAVENLVILGQEWLFWFRVEPSSQFVLDTSGVVPGDHTTVAWQFLLVPQSWTLSMELMFYLLVPFLARMGTRTLVGLALASIAVRQTGRLLPIDFLLWQGRFFPSELFLFLFGMLAHRALPLIARVNRSAIWGVGLLLLQLALIGWLPRLGLRGETNKWLIYVAVAVAIPFVFKAFANVRFDRWLGELSYPIYLAHLLVIGVVLATGTAHTTIAILCATLLCAALLARYIDHPLDRWRQARVRRDIKPA